MRDTQIVLVFMTGHEDVLSVRPEDADAIAAAAAEGDGIPVTFDTEDGWRHVLRPELLANVRTRLPMRRWDLLVGIESMEVLRGGPLDCDGEVRAEVTRDAAKATTLPMTIYGQGLESRPPSWMVELSETAAELGIEAELRLSPPWEPPADDED